MPVAKLKQFLDDAGVRYEVIPHEEAYTTQEVAAAAHIRGREVAKTVMVKVDGAMAMAVLEAPDVVSMDRLKDVAGAELVELAHEDEFRDLFPTCEPGAMPPFGNLWSMDVFVDEKLREDDRIAFNAGTHDELMRLDYADFERLVKPVVARLSVK